MNNEQRPPKPKILYIDDEEHNLASFKATLRREFKVFTAISTKEARELMALHEFEVIVTDQRMPEELGVDFLESIIETHPEPIRMLLTGFADIEAVIGAINKGQVYKYITKPWNADNLLNDLQKACEVFRLRRENEELTEKLKKANEQLEFLLRQKLLD